MLKKDAHVSCASCSNFNAHSAQIYLTKHTEIEARRAQYGYYRDRLLDFPRKAGATRSMLWILGIGSMST